VSRYGEWIVVTLVIVALAVGGVVSFKLTEPPRPAQKTTAGGTAAPVSSATLGPESPSPTPVANGAIQKRLKAHARSLRNERTKVEAFSKVQPITLRVTTFNVLGSNHTRRGADAARYASGVVRARRASQVVDDLGSDLVGFQEMQRDQLATMQHDLGGTYSFFPGTSWGSKGVPTNVMWRTDRFQMVTSRSVVIPFVGQSRPMPVVLLEDRATHQRFWFFNAHNSPNGRQSERNVAVAREIAMVRALEGTHLPILFSGDFNEKATVFCKVLGATELTSAAGGSDAGGCRPPGGMRLDQIFGTGTFSNFAYYRNGLIAATTDHHVASTTVELTAPRG